MHFLDTCICIDFLRGRLPHGYREMRDSKPGKFKLPAIVAAELWYSAEHSSNPERELSVVGAFLEAFAIAPFDAACAREYGRIRQSLSAAGKLIGDRDMMIAACALANSATLITNKVREFQRIEGLRIESWAEVPLED